MLRRLNGFQLILAATAISGIAGYLVTWFVYRQIGAAAYATFAIFWAALFLVVGGLSGIQQEITRATRPLPPESLQQRNAAKTFGVALAVVIFVLILATASLWATAVFRDLGWSLVWPLAVGSACYVLVATLAGSLYGLSNWRPLAAMIVADGVLRLLLLVVVLAMTQDPVVLAWAVALPFPLVILLLWPFLRAGLAGQGVIDVGFKALSWNVSRTVLASISSAVLISGFPLVLGVFGRAEQPALLGELIFVITLVRAPLIIIAMSLQSYFVVQFRDQITGGWKLFLQAQGVITGGGAAIAVLGWFFGPVVFGWVSGQPVTLSGTYFAILVASSALVASLCVSGPAVLARSQHVQYSVGWVVAAIATVGIMMLPVDFQPKVALTLILGPVAGLVVHLGALVVVRRGDAFPVAEHERGGRRS